MSRNGFSVPKILVLIPLLAALIALVACGGDATSTPQPTATPTAAAVPPTPTPTTAAVEPTATTAAPMATPTRRPATPTPTPAPTPTPTPAFATSEIDQLVIATAPFLYDSLMPWAVASISPTIHMMMESLLSIDINTGVDTPRLATKWELSDDGLEWTLTLREGVPFHSDWGEFTANDVDHTLERLTSEESVNTNNRLFGQALEQVEVVDDYKIVLRLTKPGPDLNYDMSGKAGGFVISNQRQWREEGEEGFLAGPAGTGPWRYVDWSANGFTLVERVEDHYRITPEFRELRMNLAPEAATKLAMLLTGEAHIVDLPKDLQEEALSRGFSRITGTFPSGTPWYWIMGGLYFETPDALDTEEALTDIRVREAINRAIDRQEMIETIFHGRGEIATHVSFQSFLQGWDTAYPEEWESKYGFDPDRARELLSEAGYADGFKLKLYDIPWGGAPEIHQVVEAVALYLQDVGIDATIESVDFGVTQDKLRNKRLHGYILPQAPYGARPSAAHAFFLNYSGGGFVAYEDELLDERFETLEVTAPLDQRDNILRDISRQIFDNYGEIALFHTFFEAIIDPNVVADYPIPGNYSSPFTHTEHIVAARSR